jgi:hypothetical protein
MIGEGCSFKRVWNTLARTKTPAAVAFGSWLGPRYSKGSDIRDFSNVENLLKVDHCDVILDAGCGALARALTYFGSKGLQIVGVDISVAALLKAGRAVENSGIKKGVSLVAADVEFLPFRENTFDKIMAMGLIVHLPSKRSVIKALQEMRFCMKNEGVCYFDWLLNLYSLFGPLLALLARINYIGKAERIQMLNFKGVKEISTICGQAGLVVSKIIHGSIFWYAFYLLPDVLRKWSESVLRVLGGWQNSRFRVSFPPYSYDLIGQKKAFIA